MEEAKKSKRPRIGTLGQNSPSAEGHDQETRYEKVNYPTEGYRKDGEFSGEEQSQRPYQRSYGYNQSRQGGYNNPQRSGYGQRNSGYGAQNRQGGYGQNRQGGYNSQNRQGGYNNQPRQNGYRQNSYGHNGEYQQRPNGYSQSGEYTQRQPGQYQQRQNGYSQNRQGSYGQNRYNNSYGNQNRQGGNYNQNRQNGGYNNQNRQGGYNQNRPGGSRQNNNQGMRFMPRPKQIDYVLDDIDPNEEVRLNKYMANAGICSRREADEYIQAGKVKVNGEVVTELGTKISRNDVVEYDDKVVTPERKCYVLLNKPKDCVTTSDDPNGRTTVLDIVKNACNERIYPVGRLDRNTTGVLLLTNDGDLASKLTHPKFVKKKIYHVWTDKDIAEEDMQRIADGIELEDGEIHADAISYVSDIDRNQAGVEIHSGRNRIVRRIFESLGYRVTKLDRVYFAGLTKKNLPRGRWRYLTQEEVNYLRMGAFE